MAIMTSRGKLVSFKLTSRQGFMLFTLLVAVTSVTCDEGTSNAVDPSRAVFSQAAPALSMIYDAQRDGISWVKDLKHLKEEVRMLTRAVDKLYKLEIAQISMMEALSESVARISSRIDADDCQPHPCPDLTGHLSETGTTLSITVDNDMELYIDGKRVLVPNGGDWRTVKSVRMPNNTRVIAVKGIDHGVVAGILASTVDGRVMTNQTWKCTADMPQANWATVEFDDRAWPAAVVSYRNLNTPNWGTMGGISTSAWWIWTGPPSSTGPGFRPVAYCRFRA